MTWAFTRVAYGDEGLTLRLPRQKRKCADARGALVKSCVEEERLRRQAQDQHSLEAAHNPRGVDSNPTLAGLASSCGNVQSPLSTSGAFTSKEANIPGRRGKPAMSQRSEVGEVRLPSHEESIAAVTILDGQGRVVRVVSATEFRRAQGARTQPVAGPWRRGGRMAVTSNAPGPRTRLVRTPAEDPQERT